MLSFQTLHKQIASHIWTMGHSLSTPSFRTSHLLPRTVFLPPVSPHLALPATVLHLPKKEAMGATLQLKTLQQLQ